jgi:iron complex transport system substrate-binding protein
MKRTYLYILLGILYTGCGPGSRKSNDLPAMSTGGDDIGHAAGLHIEKEDNGLTIIEVSSPWPDAGKGFSYALVPQELAPVITLPADAYDAIITVPVNTLVVTSTTHIPALESLGVLDRLAGFPGTRYISSTSARSQVESGAIADVGSNEAINTEIVLELQPDLVVGFAVGNQNKAYDVLQDSGIPVVYNGDWTEESPLGKAEWIKFFAPFFGLEEKADSIFRQIEGSYMAARELAATASEKPTVLSGALYKDVWYLPGGNSWASQFLEDAHAHYLWRDNTQVGSLSLSIESVLAKAENADFWIAPSQYTAYSEMERSNRHYTRFSAFREKKVYTYALTKGATGGYEYYELAPSRPDIVLQDLIHILHPGLLPTYTPYFFKPLE